MNGHSDATGTSHNDHTCRIGLNIAATNSAENSASGNGDLPPKQNRNNENNRTNQTLPQPKRPNHPNPVM